jgi:hypothetical protein
MQLNSCHPTLKVNIHAGSCTIRDDALSRAFPLIDVHCTELAAIASGTCLWSATRTLTHCTELVGIGSAILPTYHAHPGC